MDRVKEIFGGEKKREESREGEYGYGSRGTAAGEPEYGGHGQQHRHGHEYERETPGYGGGSTKRSGYSGVTGRERGTEYGGTGPTGYGGETGYGTFSSSEGGGLGGRHHGTREETTGYGGTTGCGGMTGGGTTGYGGTAGGGTTGYGGTTGVGTTGYRERHGERGYGERGYGEREHGERAYGERGYEGHEERLGGRGEERLTEEEKMRKEYEGHKRGERIGEAIAAGAAAYAAHERHERKEDEEDIKERQREAEGGHKKHGWFG